LIRPGTSVSLVVSNQVGQVELMRTRIKFLIVFAAFFLVTPFLRAADAQWPAKIGSLTAESGAIGTQNLVTKATANTTASPFSDEAGLVGVSSQTYEDGSGGVWNMRLYTYRDSSGAYQAYTLMRAPGWTDIPNPNPGIVLINGNRVLATGAGLSAEERKSVDSWLRSISDGVASPPIAEYLPKGGKEPLSERYALGPIGFKAAARMVAKIDAAAVADEAGFNSHAEAMFAKYKSAKDEATLLLIDYPTPQLAELHLRHLQRALADAKLMTSSIERKGSLLSIVLAPTSAEFAEKLRAGVTYETQVTWNEASQAATDPPILSTVAKIFIATGVFMVVTVVIGIAFGGVRIITKRLFPGKVFDRKDQIEVLQLGLSSKPIDPTDMY
jgi:hypothetical protein